MSCVNTICHITTAHRPLNLLHVMKANGLSKGCGVNCNTISCYVFQRYQWDRDTAVIDILQENLRRIKITYGTLSNKTFWCLIFNTMQFTPITLQNDCPIMIQLTAICRILKQIFNKTCFYWWFISEVIALHKFGYFAAIYAMILWYFASDTTGITIQWFLYSY